MNLHILFEDNHLLVLKKDFMTKIEELDKQVEGYIVSKKQKVGYLKRLYHLDQLASGIVVYVLTSKAFERLEQNETYFKFLSVNVGSFEQGFGYFNANVEKLPNNKLGIAPPIKNSFTISFYYKLLSTQSKINLVESSISTPNTDALRFGFSQIGVPVFGDKLYGGDSLAQNTNLALLLFETSFEHPTTHQKMLFRCSPVESAKPWAYFDLNKLYKI